MFSFSKWTKQEKKKTLITLISHFSTLLCGTFTDKIQEQEV